MAGLVKLSAGARLMLDGTEWTVEVVAVRLLPRSWTWARSTSAGPMPAASNAAAAATAVGEGADSIAMDGLKTSNEPNDRVRSATDRSSTGGRDEPRSRAPRASTSTAGNAAWTRNSGRARSGQLLHRRRCRGRPPLSPSSSRR